MVKFLFNIFEWSLAMSSSQKIVWDRRYNLGMAMVDKQHKKIFELVNKIYEIDDSDNVKEDIKKLLYEFKDYMQVHFEDEEKYMESIAYPNLQKHRELHEKIIQNVMQVIQKPVNISILKSKIKIIIKRSFIEHILQEDIKIKIFTDQNNIADEEIFEITNN